MTLEEYIESLKLLVAKEIPTGDYMSGYFQALKDIIDELKEIE
jgi:hypothetical protein